MAKHRLPLLLNRFLLCSSACSVPVATAQPMIATVKMWMAMAQS
jgi:hypothetical protein